MEVIEETLVLSEVEVVGSVRDVTNTGANVDHVSWAGDVLGN